MSYTFRKAIREQTSVLLALAGSSGSGKTYSALRLARGLAGDRGRVALIDTEAGRALHYAERFDFDDCDLKPPFAPSAYADAIAAAGGAGGPRRGLSGSPRRRARAPGRHRADTGAGVARAETGAQAHGFAAAPVPRAPDRLSARWAEDQVHGRGGGEEGRRRKEDRGRGLAADLRKELDV